jgi:hypothetical protein
MFKDYLKTAKPEIVKNGLVLWLDGQDFRNNPPESSWRDRSGQGNNATPSNFAYTASSGSDNAGGIVFDGIDDVITVPNKDNLALLASDFTIEVSFKLASLAPASQMLYTRRTAYNSNCEIYIYYINNGNFNFCYTTDGITPITVGIPFTASVGVNYIANFIRSGSNLIVFINNIYIGTYAITGTVFKSTAVTSIGASYATTVYSSYLIGTINRVLQYNRALSVAEIKQNYISR